MRLVVVGQEQGAKPARVTLDAKTAMVMTSGLLHRYSADGNYAARNPHMRGTTSALRVLLGGELGDDHDGEFLDLTAGKRVHMFDAFALVNALLCGAHPPDTTRGSSTRVMRENCLRHFKATLRVLEPTVIVLQGRGVAEWTGDLFEAVEPVNAHADRVRFEGRELYLCRFTHPAARAPQHWGNSLNSSYLLSEVVPTLRLVRERALG